MTLEDIQKEWVRRLRSAEIQQATGALGRTDGSRCCLGVLCDIAVEQGITDKRSNEICIDRVVYGRVGNYSSDLPPEVCVWAQLNSDNCEYTLDGNSRSLASDNDGGSSFSTIANTIESQPEGLFQ